jgi:hypothetical protein
MAKRLTILLLIWAVSASNLCTETDNAADAFRGSPQTSQANDGIVP